MSMPSGTNFHRSYLATDSSLIRNTLRFSCHLHTYGVRSDNRNRQVSVESSVRIIKTDLQNTLVHSPYRTKDKTG